MSQAFIIMQIGNPELDRVCEQVIVPALKACGLDPKRVDKHNKGGLLKNEIIGFIKNSDIIVADLTNERPNCYLEVGYTMGLGKFENLILTAREDHNPDSPNHRKDGPKIHFDLIGYDILFWNPNDIDQFRSELEKRIQRRQIISVSSDTAQSRWDREWIERHRTAAKTGLQKAGLSGYMEFRSALSNSKPNRTQNDLLQAADQSQIHTFGWPIGIVGTSDSHRPRPTKEGIVSEIYVRGNNLYDYWALRSDGDYYLLNSLFEDSRNPKAIFFNTRIVRITEAVLHCARLYKQLGIPENTLVHIGIRHGGLAGRLLSAVGNRTVFPRNPSTEDEVDWEIQNPLTSIESEIVEIVKQLTKPLFVVFDFFELSDSIYSDIVNNFVNGKVT
jgi:hypothetical protein